MYLKKKPNTIENFESFINYTSTPNQDVKENKQSRRIKFSRKSSLDDNEMSFKKLHSHALG